MTSSDQRALARTFAALCSAAALAVTTPASAADPTIPECLDANEASIARRRELKLRDAQAQLLICAASSCPAEVREECNRRMTEVKAATPTLVLGAKTAAGADVADVVVTMDGSPFATRLDGLAKEVDPGEHLFTFEMSGAPKTELRITLREGEKARRETAIFGGGAAAAAPSPPPSSDTSAGLGPLKIAGIAAAGLGVISLGVGAFFGLGAISLKGDANCNAGVCPDAAAAANQQDAVDKASIATPLFIVGGVLVGGGAALYFLAPSSKKDAPAASARLGVDVVRGGGAALSWSGSW